MNAGAVILPLTPLADTDPTEWDRVHSVNLRGAWLVARAAVPLMRRRGGGAIVFTASISGMRGHPGSGAYAASKAGVLGLSRSLAAEVAGDGIRVNCVCPGAVATPMGGTLEELEPFARINPLGRVALPEDIAAAITFLASNDARHITGTELVVDGGISSRRPFPRPPRLERRPHLVADRGIERGAEAWRRRWVRPALANVEVVRGPAVVGAPLHGAHHLRDHRVR